MGKKLRIRPVCGIHSLTLIFPCDKLFKTQHIATLLGHVACVLPSCCNVLRHVEFEPTTPNTSQHVAKGWLNGRTMLRDSVVVVVVRTRPRAIPLAMIAIKPRPNDRNMSTQHIATLLGATCYVRLVSLLRRVGCCLNWSNLSQQHPTRRNMSQQGGQTHATRCAQQCCDVLRWHVAIVWPGLQTSLL